MNGCIFIPAAELIKMIDPPRPPSMICCAPAITVFHVPVTLTSITSRNDSGVISFQAWGAVMPALATMMSSRPRVAAALLTTSRKPSKSRTSIAEAMIRRPAASTSRTVSAKPSGVAESYRTQDGSLPAMSTATMSAPSRAIRTACARPWPRAAPVMNATLSVNRPVMCAPYRKGHCNGNDNTSLLALGRLDQVRTDDQPLNLAGSLVQAQQAHVAVDTFDRHLAHVSAATVDLHGEIGDLAGHLGTEHLGRRRGDPPVLISEPQPGGVTDERATGHHPGLLVGEHRLHQSEVPDRRAALGGGRRVVDGFVERPLRGPHGQRSDVNPPARQRGHRRAVSDVLAAADQSPGRYTDVGEAHVSGPGTFLSHLGVLGSNLDSGGVGRNQEYGYARSGVIGGTGPREHHEQVGNWRIGDESLLAVDHPIAFCAIANSLSAQSRRVRPRPGFGQRKRGDLPGSQRLQPGGLLLVGAEPDQHLTGDAVVGAEHRPERQRGIAQLHRQLDILSDVEPEPTPLLRDGVAEQPHVLGQFPKVVRHPVGRQNLVLAWDDGTAYELPGLGEDLLEVVVVDDRVRHESALPSSGAIAGLTRKYGTPPTVCRQRSYMKYDVR